MPAPTVMVPVLEAIDPPNAMLPPFASSWPSLVQLVPVIVITLPGPSALIVP